VSRFPRYADRPPEASDEALVAVNLAILSAFAALARDSGAVPLIVYFPSRGDFRGDVRTSTRAVLRALGDRRIAYEDLTSCLGQVPANERFIEGRPHYSPMGNAAVAKCLTPIVSTAVR
jgi:hypothetical protein